ncbi:MAG: hypothetical protein ACK2UO_18670, partial [Caldilineaceae bacterium]
RSGERFLALPDVLANMRLGGTSDSAVLPLSLEIWRIKTAYLGHPYRNALYSTYHFGRTHLSKFLRRVGLDRILAPYRRRFSVVRKYSLDKRPKGAGHI